MAGLSLTPDERIAKLERLVNDLAWEIDHLRAVKFEALERRLEALEQRKLTVADLPVAALLRKLEAVGDMDASQLLMPGSITANLLHDELRPAVV